MPYWIYWYILLFLVGWLTFPLIYRLFPALTDRGYTFSRTLGLLLWGYGFWLLTSLGILRNEPGSILLSLILVGGLSAISLRNGGLAEIRSWLATHKGLIFGIEILFLLAFAGFSIIRSANPEIVGTEKPMELAFINAILHSTTFPPHDPWLSGYAISYYYFGYVMIAMLAKLCGTPGSIAFNLGIALIFSLCMLGAYGLVYNLLRSRLSKTVRFVADKPESGSSHSDASTGELNNSGVLSHKITVGWLALFGPLFIILVSNLEGFLHMLATRGLFWSRNAAGQLSSVFWSWLDIKDLNLPPESPLSWIPTRFWWWWRASRVVQDYDFTWGVKEIINEFPFFSFLLSDLHPHVLAMPFVLLVLALALNLFLGGAAGAMQGLLKVKFVILMAPTYFWLSAIILGGMAFLNTWDFPVGVALFAVVYAFKNRLDRAEEAIRFPESSALNTWGQVFKDFVSLGLALGMTGILLYLPFYLGFSSQAGGPLPSMLYFTRGAHLWVMFAPLLLPILVYLAYLWRPHGNRVAFQYGYKISLGILFILLALMLLLAIAISLLPQLGQLYLSTVSAPNIRDLIIESLKRRLTNPGSWITLGLILAFTTGLVLRGGERKEPERANTTVAPVDLFSLLLILAGTLLVLGPDFFYLRDQFGYRINTIFKFYFQTWLIWGIVAAYICGLLLLQLHKAWAVIFRIGLVFLLAASLVYPIFGLWSKTNGFAAPKTWTLDGTAYLLQQSSDEMAAIHWLQSAPPGVIAEAVSPTGGSYTNYARVSMLSGQPAVLGWMGHERQWRGGGLEMGTRQADVERLYCSKNWEDTKAVIDQYQIRYIFVADLERTTYIPNPGSCPSGLNEVKLSRYLRVAFQQDAVKIYETPGITEP